MATRALPLSFKLSNIPEILTPYTRKKKLSLKSLAFYLIRAKQKEEERMRKHAQYTGREAIQPPGE